MLLSKARMRRVASHNLHTLRTRPISEISGSLGDLGTLLPLLIAMTISHSIHLPSTLIFTGLSNILTGLLFGIPLPVQPMKAIASIAILRSYTMQETAAAGIGVSAVVMLMSVTGLLSWATRIVPVPVVKGIQVGAGLSLVISAGEKLLRPLSWSSHTPNTSAVDNWFWALGAFFALLACTRAPRVPYALLVFILGIILATVNSPTYIPPVLRHIPIAVPSWPTFIRIFFDASLGQLPLTTLNSIIAVSHLAADLLPDVPTPSVTEIGISVASMNLIGCWFGAMPACRGSGGLAAQHRFGARSGASVVMLGLAKLLLGLVGGEAFVSLLASFPKSLLGVMVIAAGVELAKVGESLNAGARDLWQAADVDGNGELGRKPREPDEEERRERWSVMLVTIAGLLALRNDGVGFVAGILWHLGLKVQIRGPRLWPRRGASGEETESLLASERSRERTEDGERL
ncbi:unnamed protein product [Peniophora sp. CBMAI 1063]|nr:unnamed protein product [Peniophora sp. CBMAI 1063]